MLLMAERQWLNWRGRLICRCLCPGEEGSQNREYYGFCGPHRLAAMNPDDTAVDRFDIDLAAAGHVAGELGLY